MSQLDGQSTQTLAPEIPERRPSKSKTFLFKLGHWKDRAPRAMKRVESTTSKNTLLRRISHSSNQEVSSDSLGTSPITSEDRSYPLQHIKSRDITDDEIDSRTSSCGSISMHSLNPGHVGNWSSSIRDECLLCPEIRITPEISSLDAGSTNLWVAVEVTGVLRLVNDYEQNPPKLQEGRRVMSGYSAGMSIFSFLGLSRLMCVSAHLRKFGCLQSMRIELITTRDASVLEVIGNLHESKSIYVGETHLILAKLRVAKVTRGTSHIRESSSSEEIMADLENHLGRAVTSYLTVRLTYKHSGFLNYKTVAINWEGGTSSHTTKLQTEASAFIKRHNLESAWSPRTSREINTPLGVNPLIKLMEMHLPSDRARGAIRRLADDRVPIPFARRLQNSSDAAGSSEDTVKVSLGCIVAERINSAVSMEILPMQSSNLPSVASEAQPFAPQLSHVVSAANETDPARQIWSQMRKNSRGHHNYRTSISDGHYSNDSDDCSPSHLSSPDTIDEERMKIKDMALRNKRSVGADTLKSFAPSIGKGRSGTIGGVGLGVGRNWWVGSNWW